MTDPWAALDLATQFKLALAVARRRGPAFVAAFDNVVSVGAGYRLRGADEDLHDEVCLCFFVRRKWSDARSRAQKIPAFVAAYTRQRGKRVRVLIPSDVSELAGGAPQAVLNLSSGITSQVAGTPLDFGSACCRVHNLAAPGERYLLSCYHVFAADLRRPPPGGIGCVADDGTPIGLVTDVADPTGSTAMDAALIGIDDDAIENIALWGLMPKRRATDFDLAELPGRGQLFVLGRRVAPAANGRPAQLRSEPLPAFFRALLPGPTKFDYRASAGLSFFFADTIQYRSAVRPGDSGSALVDVAGMLYGMHFYGRGPFGFALSAPRLFDPGVFSVDISLMAP